MRRVASALGIGSLLLLAGCPATVGGTRCASSGGGGDGGVGTGDVSCVRIDGPGCDEFSTDQARRVVYRDDGQPYYAGQALLLENCAFCHGETSTARTGAPATMDFDAELVRAAGTAGEDEARKLLRIQARIHGFRDLIYQQVVNGQMPPRNFVPVGSRYTFEDGTPLPGIRDPEAHELLRHWLSCGSPVVERTTEAVMPCSANSDCRVTGFCDIGRGQCVGVGDVVPARMQMLEPRWSSIYSQVITTSCAGVGGACHIEGAAGGLRLDDPAGGNDAAFAYAALVGVTPGATSLACMGETSPYVEAGNADNSLLVHKLEGMDETGSMVCGSRMPIGPLLTTEQIDVIRMWIDMGAMEN